ncbi:hypothetical protein [Chitinophaga ginsengisegetis]|uniref:hypothetical protein n=1 Tax=Chitinophaga ginsengisegetis TaxID=393003 RepID=UPI000DB96FC9|nr:hypothetical protein [Chitinophaga ginsengisegetis]MDR6565459.1 hypothetical protein [Chitinophaga ginsengisegetis]MDR6645187.1 hypothetical protein [Chitinophaga ginsengisegetis]MDR6652221.1 hypothetical protein [Chitinophaga ginsengisegetis]
MKVFSNASTAVLRSSGAVVAIKTSSVKKFTEPAAKDKNSGGKQWASWGASNRRPSEYAAYFRNTGVLSGGVDIIARIAMGQGVLPMQVVSRDDEGKEVLKTVDDTEITTWLTNNNIGAFCYATIMDVIKTGHCFSQAVTNGDRSKVNRLKRTDPAKCRFGRYNTDGRIEHLYMSNRWGAGATSWDDNIVKRIPLLDRDAPLLDLLADDGSLKTIPVEFAISSNYPLFDTDYYVDAPWWSGRQWADIAMKVPEMKAVMFNNQMTIKYFITIDNQYWSTRWPGWGGFTDAQKTAYRKQAMRELDDFLSGNQNAYKSLISGSRSVPDSDKTIPFIQVTALDDKIKDGKLLPDSAAANSELLFTLILNPSLLGVDMPGGMYSGGKGGSNIREAFLAQLLIRELERSFVVKPLMVVATINGWVERYPGLTFRFPNHYLTTLDSGKNAEPINA